MLVSDYFAISDLRTLHHVVATDDEAAKMALDAGVDVELPGRGHIPQPGRTSEGQAALPKALVDQAVARMLREKFLDRTIRRSLC